MVKDVATFAAWGVDALKVDGCNQSPSIMNITYPALSDVRPSYLTLVQLVPAVLTARHM